MAIRQRPRGAALLVAGESNADLAAPEGNVRDEDITAALSTTGLEDISRHFIPQLKPWLRYGKMWSMIIGVR